MSQEHRSEDDFDIDAELSPFYEFMSNIRSAHPPEKFWRKISILLDPRSEYHQRLIHLLNEIQLKVMNGVRKSHDPSFIITQNMFMEDVIGFRYFNWGLSSYDLVSSVFLIMSAEKFLQSIANSINSKGCNFRLMGNRSFLDVLHTTKQLARASSKVYEDVHISVMVIGLNDYFQEKEKFDKQWKNGCFDLSDYPILSNAEVLLSKDEVEESFKANMETDFSTIYYLDNLRQLVSFTQTFTVHIALQESENMCEMLARERLYMPMQSNDSPQ